MIYDNIDHIALYARVHPFMPEVERFFTGMHAEKLEVGRFSLKSDELYYQVQRYETVDASESQFESHRRYIDIQCVVEGEETVFVSQTSSLTPETDYDGAKDIRFYEDFPGETVRLRPGMFAVFFPQDAHKPRCSVGGSPGKILKIVFKLAV